MKTNIFYKLIAGVYDLLDIIYFRNYDKSPRKAVIEAISENDKILDLCTGTATNAIEISQAIISITKKIYSSLSLNSSKGQYWESASSFFACLYLFPSIVSKAFSLIT